jgi:hypothetical protein
MARGKCWQRADKNNGDNLGFDAELPKAAAGMIFLTYMFGALEAPYAELRS